MRNKTARSVWAVSAALWAMFSAGAGASLISYTYDAAGRLVAVEYGGGKAINYTYDPAGNLTGLVQMAFLDSDHDGLDDNWERLYFGDLSRNGSGDFDQDGQSDLSEYLAGTDPTSRVSVLRVAATAAPGASSAVISWLSVVGKTYQIQYKDNVEDAVWKNLGSPIVASSNSTAATDSTLAGIAHRFYRIVVVP